MAPTHTFSSSRSVSLSNQSSTRSDSPALSTTGQSAARGGKKRDTPFDDYELEIIKQLKIDPALTRMGTAPKTAREFYKCYQACTTALSSTDSWNSPPKCPIVDDIIILFISKTTWYQRWVPSFRDVEKYPEMEAWLEGDNEIKVWDNANTKHTMSNVQAWCARQKKEVKKKATGKSSGSKKSTRT